MLDSLLQILPVFLIIGFGVVLDVLEVLPKRTGSVIGAYVLYVALPVLLLHILSGSGLEEILHGGFWAGFALAQIAIYLLGYLLDLAVARRGQGAAVCFGLCCSFSNVAFIGLPVVANLLPGSREAMVAAGLSVIVPNLLAIPLQVQLEYLKHSQGREQNGVRGALGVLHKSLLRNPLVLATCLGFALGLSGLGLWEPLEKAAHMVGDTTAPCMLLALGLDLRDKVRVALGGERNSGLARLGVATVMKLLLHPLLAWLLLALFGVTGEWLVVGVIMSGTATALVTTVFAEIYGHAPEEAAFIAVVTNVLNLFTLTALAAVLRAQGVL